MVKSNIPLSRMATFFHKEFCFSRGVSRLIGCFVGTDTKYLVGDTFVKKIPFRGKGPYGSRYVQLVNNMATWNLLRCYCGCVFCVGIVTKVTPCSIIVELKKIYHLYGQLYLDERGHPLPLYKSPHFSHNNLAGLFVEDVVPNKKCFYMQRTSRFILPRDDSKEFEEIDISCVLPLPKRVNNIIKLYYDLENSNFCW